MTMIKSNVALAMVFAALIVNLNVPSTIGVPEITPVDAFKLKPVGRLPLIIDQVIGVIPFTLSF